MFHLPELPADVPAELLAPLEHSMAAADFYQTGLPPTHRPPNPNYLAPPPQPQRVSSHPGYVYPPYQPNPQTPPQQFPPPPYLPAHMAKPPNQPYASTPPQRNSFSHPQRPDPQTWNQSYPPAPGPNQPMQYPPQQFAPPPQPGHRPSYSGPYLHPEAAASFTSGYSSDPEPHRRHRSQPHHKKSRSSGHSTTTDSFIGAAGGGLIGDLLFPGLGTVGGALAGWIGGKEYGEHKKRKDSQLEIEQREWEEKFDPDHRRRSGERDRSKTRKHSHDSVRH